MAKKRISVKSAKAKGRKAQQEVMGHISEMLEIPCGKDELIRSREMGQAGTDIVLLGEAKELFPFSIEVKFQENISIPKWIKQAKENKKENTDWLLIVRRSRENPIVVLDFEAFIALYKRLLNWESPNRKAKKEGE